MIEKSEAIALLNTYGKNHQPFNFYCDFLGEQWRIEPTTSQNDSDFHLAISSSLDEKEPSRADSFRLEKEPISFSTYKESFNQVIQQINIGNSFLTNLTFKTPIQTNYNLEEIFKFSQAKYRILVEDQFVVFSPETFVRTKNNRIYSYPMKGTINAEVPNAAELILNDPKETAEHVTIVDLIRNDLSQIASNVEVTKFRFIDKIKTRGKDLLQVSSEVKGKLAENWNERLGNVLTALIPAGSISGAPKPETIKIIQQTESYNRGFYTGICGHFDGINLDTGVMIRFIMQEENQYFYCSGGGITSFSDPRLEYEEMIDKIYLPFRTD